MIHWGWFVGSWILLSLSVFAMAWVLHCLHRDEKMRLRVALARAVRVMQGDTSLDREQVIEEALRVL